MPYKIVIEPEAKAWLDQQTEDVRQRVLLILSEYAAYPQAGKQLQNAARWYDSEWGWAYRIRIDSIYAGLRCIYFIWVQGQEMIVVKFGTHADNVYEDGN